MIIKAPANTIENPERVVKLPGPNMSDKQIDIRRRTIRQRGGPSVQTVISGLRTWEQTGEHPLLSGALVVESPRQLR